MRKNNVFKTLIIVLALVWSVVVLLPTLQLNQLRGEAEAYYIEIEENTSLTTNEVRAALAAGNLELEVRDNFDSDSSMDLQDIVDAVDRLIDLDEKIVKNEPQAIKLGLDLQGGTYLVYEIDLPQLLESLSKERDDGFEASMAKIRKKVRNENADFFDVLQEVYQEEGLRLNRYFGKRQDSDSEIISALQDEAKDAVERTLEVLRNRIDEFGVSEPSITRQGARRIVIELAGIQDIGRAKKIIGTTALLEFQLVLEPDVARAIRREIDRVMKRQLTKSPAGDLEEVDLDSLPDTAKIRKDTEVSLEDVFGEASILADNEDSEGAADSTVLLDEEVFQDRPFSALLADLGGDMGVPTKNVRTVERILNSPEVKEVLPNDAEFVFLNRAEQFGEQEYYRLHILKKEPELTGDKIANASVQIGSELQAGQAEVGMELTGEGAKIFSKVTGANIDKRLAIVLDGKVVSTPNIKDRISGGRARISGMANMEEAKDLAIVLRAGALPAPIEVIEERTVGPSLGQDSIRKGTYSALVGLGIVLIFMVIYYRLSGLVANIALLLNLLIIMAVLAGFHATLTLPGIAGIILTIGMAVDANVLIFERIREELRHGKTIRAAIDSGYARAFKTILDANVTTLLTALVLYQFGTGPIRGFAFTLSIGILASMFTAIVMTRVIFDYFTSRMTLKQLSI